VLQVFNYPLPPEADEESTAREMGWLPPDPVRSLLSDYTITVDLPPLLDESLMPPQDHANNPPAAAGTAVGAASNTTAALVEGTAVAGQKEAGGVNGSSSLPHILAAHMRSEASPMQVRQDMAAAAAAAAVGGAATANGLSGVKRARSPSTAGRNGNSTSANAPAAGAVAAGRNAQDAPAAEQDQQQLTLRPDSNGVLLPAPKKPNAAAGTAAEPDSLGSVPPGQQAPAATRLPTLAERKAQLAAVPLPSRSLVLMALTCASCHEAFDFERMEFLGDVILKALAAHVLLGVRRCGVS
jgi:hypothetical protein